MYTFRDPIHGFIEVSDLELKIIDSAPFQRLRNIKQLATTYLVYHGAEHTRFGHSIGVMHLVTRAFESAVNNYKKEHSQDLFSYEKYEWYKQILRLIALTHDLGHAPFSHVSETLFDNGVEHEDFTKKIMIETEIADKIREIGQENINKFGAGYDITPELLWLIYGEKSPELDSRYIMPDFKLLKSFMDSDLDWDKMDYLLRDSHYCGVNYGMFDLNRLISSLSVYQDERNNSLQLAVKRGGIHAFEEFVIARYFMFIQVYFHKTRRYLDHLLVESIKTILPNSKYPEKVDEYLKWDDDKIIESIKAHAQENNYANQFMNREVMSCVYETRAHGNQETDLQLFQIIKKEVRDKKIAIYEDRASKAAHKIRLEPYDSSSGKGIPILVKHSLKPSSISSESILLKSLINPIEIKRLYVKKEHMSTVTDIIKDKLDTDEREEDD